MSRPNPYINTFYLAVHFGLNILVVVLVINLVEYFVPVKHMLSGYHMNFHQVTSYIDFQKCIAGAFAACVAYWYYQRKKAKEGDTINKH